MNILRLFFVLFLIFLTSLFSCQEESKSSAPEVLTEEVDSISEEMDKTRSIQPETEVEGAGLIGKWKLIERKMGVQVLEMQENEESTLEFTSEGKLISDSDGFEPETFSFTRIENLLTSDLWDTSQSIKSLSSEELVLVYQVDGVAIDHVYKRVN